MPKHAQWFNILVVAREFDDDFTASSLAASAKISKTDDSTASQIAAAWLRKFEKWGYVTRTGSIKSEGPRPALLWKVTDKGKECELRDSLESRFTRLLGVVREYQDALGQGTRKETEALTKLRDVTDEVDPSKAADAD